MRTHRADIDIGALMCPMTPIALVFFWLCVVTPVLLLLRTVHIRARTHIIIIMDALLATIESIAIKRLKRAGARF